jgi:hypothetical protein
MGTRKGRNGQGLGVFEGAEKHWSPSEVSFPFLAFSKPLTEPNGLGNGLLNAEFSKLSLRSQDVVGTRSSCAAGRVTVRALGVCL